MEAIKNVYVLTDEEVARLKIPVAPPTPTGPPPVSVPVGEIRVPGVTHEYSTFYPGNPDHRKFLFQYSHGAVGLFDSSGALHHVLPSRINTSSQPRWRRKHPTQFLYLYLDEIRSFDVASDSDTLVRKFNTPPYAFPSITTKGEADISLDDDHLPLCSGQTVFMYQISTDRVISQFVAPWAFDNLYPTADNKVLISFYPDASGLHRGVHVYDGQLRKLTAAIGHQDTGRDTNGDPILVWCNSADGSGPNQSAQIPNCANGIVKVNTNTGKQTCLTPLDWSLAMHISLPDNQPWCLVSTYDPKNPASEKKYANEWLKVALDGSGVQSLGKHGCATPRTAPTADAPLGRLTYTGQPRASVSPDGTRMIYSVNGDVVIRPVPA